MKVPLQPGTFQEAENILGGYAYRLPLPGVAGILNHQATTRFDFRRSSSDLLNGNLLLTEDLTETFHWALGYDASITDPWGTTDFGLELILSPGGISGRNDDAAYSNSRQFADARYTIYKFEAKRQTRLPYDFTLVTAFSGQMSDSNLLSNEQLNLGGYNTVRGYTENEVRGDSGYFSNIELRTPSVSFGELFDLPSYKDGLQFLGFWDYGVVGNKVLLPAENRDAELSSAGFGVRYYVDRYFTLRVDYGFQLLDTGFNNRFASRLHLGIVLSY
ncbi:MAG: ShlB/FhaC/HecB family hemolysin secretion/activation protein [Blastochloris sp.]|nr:ShlB/FhaC/HecB family hemolysin secretion/activation protein [Blastochloris sp.]